MMEHTIIPTVTEATITTPADHVTTADLLTARIVSSLISFLSMCGAMLIILSYVFFKDVRTKGREVLCNLSLADFGVASSNFVGAVWYFSQYINECKKDDYNGTLTLPCSAYTNLCKTQAFFSSYCTLSSFMWSMLLALYIYTLVLDTTGRKFIARWLVTVGYVFCWGMAAVVSVWLISTGKLGYTKIGGGGWCTLRVETKTINFDGNDEVLMNTYVAIFAVNMWAVVTFLMVLVLYTSSHIYMRIRRKELNDQQTLYGYYPKQQSPDHKFLLIPFAFLILRLGGLVFSVCYIYTNWWHRMSPILQAIIYFAMVFGDCGQGMVNGVLFCLLTPRIRKKVCCCRSMCDREKNKLISSVIFSETYEQKRLLDKLHSSSYHTPLSFSTSH